MKCQATRSRSQNEKIARQLLADKVEQKEKGEESRVSLTVAAARKKKASKMKKARRKYRSLDAESQEQASEFDAEMKEDQNRLAEPQEKRSGTEGLG